MSIEPGLASFMETCLRLKVLGRRGWSAKAGVSDPESVADHTFGTALLAMVMADLMNLDVLKVLRMALLHDIGEAIIGDLMPEEAAAMGGKEAEEARAVERMVSKLPPKLAKGYAEAWREFAGGSSPEAAVVREADKLEMALQAASYALQDLPEDLLAEFVSSAEAATRTEIGKGLLAEVRRRIGLS